MICCNQCQVPAADGKLKQADCALIWMICCKQCHVPAADGKLKQADCAAIWMIDRDQTHVPAADGKLKKQADCAAIWMIYRDQTHVPAAGGKLKKQADCAAIWMIYRDQTHVLKLDVRVGPASCQQPKHALILDRNPHDSNPDHQQYDCHVLLADDCFLQTLAQLMQQLLCQMQRWQLLAGCHTHSV